MKQIANWTLGSFFRSIGRFLFYILLALLISQIIDFKNFKLPNLLAVLDVHADSLTDAWYLNMNQIERGSFYNWTGSNTLGSSISTSSDIRIIDIYDDHNNSIVDAMPINYIYNSSAINVGSNGVSIGANSARIFYQGYIYRTVTYVCSTKSLTRYSSTSTTIGTNANDSNNYSFIQLISINVPYDLKGSIDTNINYCYAINGIINPSVTAYNVWSRVTGTTGTTIYIFGYYNEVLGNANNLTSSQVQNIINNSGLATATDIASVNRSIEQMSSDIQDQTEQQHEDHQETIDTLTDDDSSGATGEAGNFFNNFTTNTHGLTGIITAPLSAIQSLTSQSCSPLVLPLPFVNQNLTLPCMRPIYDQHFGSFMQIYDVITLGIISYWVMVRIFSLVKDFKNPEHDEVEVLDL